MVSNDIFLDHERLFPCQITFFCFLFNCFANPITYLSIVLTFGLESFQKKTFSVRIEKEEEIGKSGGDDHMLSKLTMNKYDSLSS